MIAVKDFANFASVFERRKDERDLFAFLLFDERETHESIAVYAEDQFEWLNSLAIEARIFFFAFVPYGYEGRSVNPGPRVASLFGIGRNQLPGIVLFTMLDTRDGTKDFVYYRLDPEVFTKSAEEIEAVFVELFGAIKESNTQGKDSDELLKDVRRGMNAIRRADRMRPVEQYFRELGVAAVSIPKDFLGAIGGAFADAVAGKAVGDKST